jgi:hypothetical protein
MTHARRVIELDPGRRYAYGALAYLYALAAGLWGGATPAVHGESGSLATMIGRRSDVRLVHVLRDSFETVAESSFMQWPAAERGRVRRRAADAGMQWVERWLAAGPDDTEALIWASRLEELRGDLPAALRFAERAALLGADSPFESVVGRRLMLLLYTGALERAGALADSLTTAGALRLPFMALMDRGFVSGAQALLATQRFDRAAEVARRVGGLGTPTGLPCEQLIHGLRLESPAPPPDGVAAMVIDSVIQHAAAFAARDELRPCLRGVALTRPDPARQAARAARLAAIADSLAAARSPLAPAVADAAVSADSTLRSRLAPIR